MEILNKHHKELSLRMDTRTATVSVSKDRFNFSGATVEMANMLIGRYVHFILDGDCWAFIVNDNPAGYKLFPPCRTRVVNSMYVHCRAVTDKFRTLLKITDNPKYYVVETKSTFEGHKVYEILTHKPINRIGVHSKKHTH